MAELSISVVKGRGSLNHNNREFTTQNVNETLTKNNVIYKQESLEEAYRKLFKGEVERYNVGKKPCRQIPDYIEHIRGSKNGEKLFYETVVQIGNKFDCAIGSRRETIAKSVLDEYMIGFQEKNPNLYVFNAVMHMDEATPHLHIDYIPVAHGFKNGLQVRNSLDRALKEQGIDGKANKKENSTHNWQNREKDHIEEIMKNHELERAEEKGLKRQHMTVEQYKTVAEQVKQEIKQIPKQIETAPLLMNKSRVSVEKSDLEKLEQRAKLSLVHENVSKELVNNMHEALDLTQQGYQSIKGKEHSLKTQKVEFERFKTSEIRKIDNYKAEQMKTVENLKSDLKEKIAKQENLNDEYRSLEFKYTNLNIAYDKVLKENNDLKSKIVEMQGFFKDKTQELVDSANNHIRDLLGKKKEEIKGYESKIENLTERLKGMTEVVTNITKAVGLLTYDKGEYKADLTRTQAKLLDAIPEYAKFWIERTGGVEVNCEVHKKDIDSKVGISKGIQSYITPDYHEIIYYKGEKGYGFYSSKAEGSEYLGSKADYKELKETFLSAKFKDPYEHIPSISGYDRSM
jgi:hypothetical protein